MSHVLEVDAQGALYFPSDLLRSVKPHTRYVVDIYGETLILHPEKSQPFWPMVVSEEQAETLHQLRDSINRTKQRLREFENRYGVTSDHFLREMTAEDLHDGDLEYVEWAGEASLLEGLEGELRELQDAYYKLP